jgi:hypothetical protein
MRHPASVRLPFVLLFLLAIGCAAASRATHVALVTLGAGTHQLHAEHHRAYRLATDALIARMRAGGSLEQYDHDVMQMDREFAVRGDALALLASGLYSAAALRDALAQGGPRAALLAVAREVLQTVEQTLVVLQQGGALAPLHIPTEIRTGVAALRALFAAAVPTDAGAPDAPADTGDPDGTD